MTDNEHALYVKLMDLGDALRREIVKNTVTQANAGAMVKMIEAQQAIYAAQRALEG